MKAPGAFGKILTPLMATAALLWTGVTSAGDVPVLTVRPQQPTPLVRHHPERRDNIEHQVAIRLKRETRPYRAHPLMHGEGFNYDLYYNYHLTPHLILRPNLQFTTKPGAIENNATPYVGGISAGINF